MKYFLYNVANDKWLNNRICLINKVSRKTPNLELLELICKNQWNNFLWIIMHDFIFLWLLLRRKLF